MSRQFRQVRRTYTWITPCKPQAPLGAETAPMLSLNSVGVQHFSVLCCAPTEHCVHTLHHLPRATAIALHGVIHMSVLRTLLSGTSTILRCQIQNEY